MNSQPQKPRLGFLKNGGVPADLSKLPRCTATAKHSGKRCKRIALKGKTVCQFHGGLGGGPKGKRNGSYKHGRFTKETLAAKKSYHALSLALDATMGIEVNISKEQVGLVAEQFLKKPRGYQKKKAPGFVPKKKRKYFCVFQKGGPIWGIGLSRADAIYDSWLYIEDEFELHDTEDFADCPDGDYIVMRCSKVVYDIVDLKGGGAVKYYVCHHNGFYQLRKMVCQGISFPTEILD